MLRTSIFKYKSVHFYAMKEYGGRGGVTPLSTLALDGRRVVSLKPRERAAGTHWIAGSVDPRDGRDVADKKNTSYPCRESNHDSWMFQSRSLIRIPHMVYRIMWKMLKYLFWNTRNECIRNPVKVYCSWYVEKCIVWTPHSRTNYRNVP